MAPQVIGDVLAGAAVARPNAPAVSLGEQTVTYAGLLARARAVAGALVRAGVRPGDRVAWQSPTSIDAVAVYFATALTGAMFTPINPRATEPEMRALMNRARPAITLGAYGSDLIDIDGLLGAHRVPAEPALPTVDPGAGQAVFFTSGTSGTPKGCVLSHRTQLLRSGLGAPWPAADTVCMFPQFHMAHWLKALEAWIGGAHVVLVERADAGVLLDAIERHRAARLYCIPAVWERILDADLTSRDLVSLRIIETGTSTTSERFLGELAAAFPQAQISVVYGSTEAGVVCLLRPADIPRKPGSVGPPFQNNELRLGDGGELLVRNTWLCNGYLNDPAATEASMVDGWYRTGDRAERDEEGYVRIVGRVGDAIRTGGETVAPVEVEAALRDHPAVADVAVVGLPDERWGEIVTAAIVLHAGHALTLEALREHCRQSLAAFKQPRRLVLVPALPRTGATDQIQRRILLAELVNGEATRPDSAPVGRIGTGAAPTC